LSAIDLTLVTLVLLLVGLPGWAVVRRLAPLRSEAEAAVLGAALGVATHAALGVFAPSLLGLPLALADGALAIGLLLAPGARRLRFAKMHRSQWLALASVVAVAASFLALVLENAAPRGWDPSFHTLLIDRIVATGQLPRTWEPWEPVAVHYTLGFHAIVAHVARVTHLPAHAAFQGAFPFAYALLAASGLFLVRGLTRGRLVAVFATLALGLLAARIRLIYFWGGLPTVLGLALALGAAQALTRVPGRRGLLLGAVLLAGLPYLHHLSALIAWATFLAVALVLVLRRETRPAALRALLALAVAALLALPLVPRVLEAVGARDATSIFHFADEPELPLGDYPLAWGHALFALALLGVAALFRRPRRDPATRPGTLAALAFLVGVHVLLDVVYREIARRRTGEDFSALTPSRWLAYASVPLALLAGEGAALLLGLARRRARLAAPLVALALVGLALPGYVRVELGSRSIDPEVASVASWVRGQVPESSLVVVRARSFVLTGKPSPADAGLLPSRHWWPYFLGLETDETPLPASEPRLDPRVLAKRAIRDRGAEDPDAARAIAKARGKRLYWLGPAALAPPPGAVRLGTYADLVALDEAR
jgi:hypothetical protein